MQFQWRLKTVQHFKPLTVCYVQQNQHTSQKNLIGRVADRW